MFTKAEAGDDNFGRNTIEGARTMPQIIVTADRTNEREEGAVMLRERVTVSDFESDHFAAKLVERLGWAVGDAHQAESVPTKRGSAAKGDS
jgi:hypothetical protein